MDLQQIWNQQDPRDDGPLPLRVDMGGSHHPLARLRRALILNIGYGLVVSAAMCLLLIKAEGWPLSLAFTLVTAFCLWAVFDTWRLLTSLDPNVSTEQATLTELRRHHGAFVRWMRTQQRAGWFFYPISAFGGGLWGAVVGADAPVHIVLQKTSLLLVLILLALIMSPLCAWLARWMFQHAFGNQVDRLREMIRQLEA